MTAPMSSVREIYDPFLRKTVQISDRIGDRLRGRYACGPTLENGEPEFGWREFETPPIQHEAAVLIDVLRAALEQIANDLSASVFSKDAANKAIADAR
jgi:hypothetical protein